MLLVNGADISLKAEGGDTALHRAAQSSSRLVQVFLDAGANVAAVNDNGATPLLVAAAWGGSDQVQLLLNAASDLEARTQKGETVLHLTAGEAPDEECGLWPGEGMETEEKAEIFLSAGVDVNARTYSGQTALSRARSCNRQGLVRLLEARGATN
jgi:ankyrin repeat protein